MKAVHQKQNNFDLHQLNEKLKLIYQKRGVSFNLYSPESLVAFEELPVDPQRNIFERISSRAEVLSNFKFKHEDRETVEEDIELLQLLFRRLKISAPLGGNFEFLTEGLIIEAYNSQMQQIYRNIGFYRQCIYDELTLELFPWTELYERDETVSNAMMKQVIHCFTEKEGKNSLDH
jgi:hypothetical protein